MSFDLTRTKYFYTKEVPVAPTETVEHEGAVIKGILVAGEEAGKLTEGTSNAESIIGFSENSNLIESQRIAFETGAVPAAGAYTLQLAHGDIVSGQIRVYDATNAVELTVITTGNPAAGEVLVSLVSGLLTFNVAKAGVALQIRYKYNLSQTESTLFNGERPVNAKANTAQNTITVIRGHGELYTDQYDVTKDFSAVVGNVFAGANGIITTDNAKTPIAGSRVVHVPTAADRYLGIAFDLA
jgi:hypothetical protein